MEYSPFKYFTKNRKGRDFVVGDLHGMFSSFSKLLDQVDFDYDADRVFSVGDLVDRGSESHRAVEFLTKPWFFSIMGNHEYMLIESEDDERMQDNWVNYCGGDWWKEMPDKLKPRIRKKFSKLPLAMEVEAPCGNVGIVHADVPLHMQWSYFIKELQTGVEMQSYSLWSRNRYKRIKTDGYSPKVEGIDLVVVGHTPVSEPLLEGNVHFIDTGATYIEDSTLAQLTMLELAAEPQLHQISTYRRELAGVRF